ncbi:MAG: alanine--tRNA ligase [Bacteroidales bacterium]
MKSAEIRQTFLDFFAGKGHQIVPSAPMVIKNDPTLMFTNAGMNQFKDIFLGHTPAQYPRVADTQKCLRVSGKHNDLEEVGHDTYHHTMFEMLGNWSFGDYFKEEAIAWAWELLTEVYKIDKQKLYITVFGGDEADGIPRDMEAYEIWKKYVPEDRILFGSKKDNFWEMGDTGPCGPCSEIHVDIRNDEERNTVPGRELVNKGHPLVIEIWNLVFIEFNRMANGSLQKLPARHVDTGMGFERLCMVLQGKQSNYDTDVFQPLINSIAAMAGKKYGEDPKADVAMRVIADHLRAISFAIADGQLPSNTKGGYVIRRILRRAVRYGYTFLGFRQPFISLLVSRLKEQMGTFFPELIAQEELIRRVAAEEESNFLRTLESGIQKFNAYLINAQQPGLIDGNFAFELYDTYGFPIDLTQLMAREQGWDVDMTAFHKNLEQQKERSRAAAAVDTDDWVEVGNEETETTFLGYDTLEAEAEIVKFRRVKTAKKTYYQVVFNRTPFYAESGGQVGDRGILISGEERIEIEDTVKENNLSVHIVSRMPADITLPVLLKVDARKRWLTANNHSATHLMHAALRKVLGTHVEQKGSLVDEKRLRFDFSHFARLTSEEIRKVEDLVNEKIWANLPRSEWRELPIEEARKMGAMALFGEKYGDKVRVIAFDPEYSVELCGGTHVPSTGQIGLFKIVSESAIAAGVRRIEALTGPEAISFYNHTLDTLEEVKVLVKNPVDAVKGVQNLLEEKSRLEQQVEELRKVLTDSIIETLKSKATNLNGFHFIATRIDGDATLARDLLYRLKQTHTPLVGLLAYISNGKPGISLLISENLASEKGWNAGQLVKDFAREIRGGGGGQPHFATAGGSFPEGLDAALVKASKFFAG